jgi:hypothetical protein
MAEISPLPKYRRVWINPGEKIIKRRVRNNAGSEIQSNIRYIYFGHFRNKQNGVIFGNVGNIVEYAFQRYQNDHNAVKIDGVIYDLVSWSCYKLQTFVLSALLN